MAAMKMPTGYLGGPPMNEHLWLDGGYQNIFGTDFTTYSEWKVRLPMGMLSFFFRKKVQTASSAKQTSGATIPSPRPPESELATRTTGIKYDPQLVDRLTQDHRRLVELFGSTLELAGAGKWGAARIVLDEFRITLNEHLLNEGVRLYAYTSQYLAKDSDVAEVFRSYKREMADIGKIVFSFCDSYRTPEQFATSEQQQRFLEDAQKISAALSHRIAREESHLYPLYRDLSAP